MLDSFKKWLSIMYLRYEIITCSEMLSPYEKVLISKYLRHELFVDIDNKNWNCFWFYFQIVLLFFVLVCLRFHQLHSCQDTLKHWKPCSKVRSQSTLHIPEYQQIEDLFFVNLKQLFIEKLIHSWKDTKVEIYNGKPLIRLNVFLILIFCYKTTLLPWTNNN